jgi:hypothetical protein
MKINSFLKNGNTKDDKTGKQTKLHVRKPLKRYNILMTEKSTYINKSSTAS